MTWMNAADIEWAVESCAGDPVFGLATRFLKSLMDSVNEQSDGWHSWPAPGRAAEKLMNLIQNNSGYGYRPSSGSSVTLKDIEEALKPIKRMAIFEKKRQRQYGNTFEFDVDLAWKKAKEDE